MPHRLRFSYWSDPLCIWALVAQQKLERILGELGEDKFRTQNVHDFAHVSHLFKLRVNALFGQRVVPRKVR